jgi:hypothetical protein
MASNAYMQGRKKYQRPQAMLWADNPGTVVDGFHIPLGNEVGSDGTLDQNGEFLILSDNNREAIEFAKERIEVRKRMVNGRMRSYHVADKLQISTSWSMLPSRSFSVTPSFYSDDTSTANLDGKPRARTQDQYQLVDTDNDPFTPSDSVLFRNQQYTTDGGAGGVNLLDWYENHTGSFWVYLAYDKFNNFTDENSMSKLGQYNQVVEVFFSDFNYSVVKRGGSNYDFWDVSVTLEEV